MDHVGSIGFKHCFTKFYGKNKKFKPSKLLGMFNWDTIWEISYSLGMVEGVGIIFIFG
jgi:hypothetical protein